MWYAFRNNLKSSWGIATILLLKFYLYFSHYVFLFSDRQLPPASADRLLLSLMQCIHAYYYLCSVSGNMLAAYPEIPWIAFSEVLGITAAAHPQNKDSSCSSMGMSPWIKGTKQNLVVIVYITHCRSSCLLSQCICTASCFKCGFQSPLLYII